jgi:hypothetical protein
MILARRVRMPIARSRSRRPDADRAFALAVMDQPNTRSVEVHIGAAGLHGCASDFDAT